VITFELAEPTTVADALRLLDPDDGAVRPLGGGTALMLMMKAGVFRPTRLVSLRRIAGLSRIVTMPDGGLVIGALTPLSDVERSNEVARRAGVIVPTMRRLSNVRVRNVATIGGCLAHGDPHMDLPPVLMALGAGIIVVGRDGERTLKVEDLFSGYYETVLKRDEIITELHIPCQGVRRAAYLKCTTGSADDWPALGVAVSFEVDGKAIRAPRVVVSAATEKATRLNGAEAVLSDAAVDDALLARAGDAAADEAETISDVRGSAPYKRELLRVYVNRAVRQAFEAQGRDDEARGAAP
jgi:carbon-monoxide dehydrogenase medium subunit